MCLLDGEVCGSRRGAGEQASERTCAYVLQLTATRVWRNCECLRAYVWCVACAGRTAYSIYICAVYTVDFRDGYMRYKYERCAAKHCVFT